MSSTDCLRLFVLCFWLLVGDVNCENTQKGYVLRVKAGQAPMGVHIDNGDHKRLSEPSIFRRPTAGHRIYQASSDSVSSTGAVHFSPRMYRARTKSTGRFSPLQVEDAPASLHSHISPDIQAVKSSLKSESHNIGPAPTRYHIQSLQPQESLLTTRPKVSGYQSAHRFHNSFKPINKNLDSTIKGRSPGSNSASKGGNRMSYPTWSPRVYSSDVMSEARGYTHVRRLRPGFNKTGPHISCAACKKILETGFPGHDSRKLGSDPGVSSSSNRQQNLNHNSRGSQPSSLHPPPPDKPQILVQGKFKPFQRLPPTDLPAHTNPPDNETAPTKEAAGTTLPPSLNSTYTTAVLLSVTGEMSTKSASPMQTEAPEAELLSQASTLEGQTGSSAEVGPSLEQNKPDSPPKLQIAEEDRKSDTVVKSALETNQSSTDLPDKINNTRVILVVK